MNYSEVMKRLKSMSNPKNVAGMARFGITGKQVLGIPIYDLRRFAKEIGVNHELALKLFDSGVHEAKILASYIDDPEQVSESQLDKWVSVLESWDEVDQICDLFSKSRFGRQKIREWVKDEREFVRRTPFAMIAWISVRDKSLLDKEFNEFFKLIKKYSLDERNYVKKAVNWALRNIGKRNIVLNKKAIKLSGELASATNKTARWIGKHALRELKSDKVQARLKKNL